MVVERGIIDIYIVIKNKKVKFKRAKWAVTVGRHGEPAWWGTVGQRAVSLGRAGPTATVLGRVGPWAKMGGMAQWTPLHTCVC